MHRIDVPTTIDLTDGANLKVLWAAMYAMVKDVHAPQDRLSGAEWQTAERLFESLDAAINT